MNRGIVNRVRQLEARVQMGLWLKLYDQESCFAEMRGSATEFFRLADALMGRAPNAERLALAEVGLNDLRRATRIEGPSVELFGLLRALALGPAEETIP